jgi:hypothetical protein
VQQLPQRPRRSLMMAHVQQQHKQQITTRHHYRNIIQNHHNTPKQTPSKTTITQNKNQEIMTHRQD